MSFYLERRKKGARYLSAFAFSLLATMASPLVASPYLAPETTPEEFSYHLAPLPPHLEPVLDDTFFVGLALEQYGQTLRDPDTQLGLVTSYRSGSLSPSLRLLVKPGKLNDKEFENSRWLLGMGLRSYFSLWGQEFSYGVGTHIEARLQDHFWLGFVSPAELGTTVLRRASWHLELFVGARRAMSGGLIHSYLVDPNGFDNENASEQFFKDRYRRPWRGFIRLVFSRGIY